MDGAEPTNDAEGRDEPAAAEFAGDADSSAPAPRPNPREADPENQEGLEAPENPDAEAVSAASPADRRPAAAAQAAAAPDDEEAAWDEDAKGEDSDGKVGEAASLEEEEEQEDWEGVSLEELGAAYARVMAEAEGEGTASEEAAATEEATIGSEGKPSPGDGDEEATAEQQDVAAEEEADHVTPEAIIEAALFVGHPEDRPLKAKQLAGIIRDVSPGEVKQTIDTLNASYRAEGQAIRIIYEDGGYKLTLAPEMEVVRRAFYGKVREARLSHEALEVLSLVAYQPGISSVKIQDQRGKESGSVLNQLVRRRLLEVRREKPTGGGRAVLTYNVTERFLNLFGLSSLDDLPQVDEADVSPS